MQNPNPTDALASALLAIQQNQASSREPLRKDSSSIDKETEEERKVGKWTPEEDELLRKYVPIYGEKQWRKVAEHIPGRTSIQCLHRWTKILKPGLVKGPWTTEEDQKLIAWVKAEGPTKWAQCANFIKGRSGKQCRERWFNNLNPGVKKGNWTKEEDELIFELYQKYGSSWSKIAKYINGRTENAIKNRFYSTLRKLAADKRKHKSEHAHSDSDSGDDNIDESPDKGKNSDGTSGPNVLYKLLQEKTCAADGSSLKDKVGDSVKQEILSPQNPSDDKPKQAFNINGEKFIVVRDHQVPDKDIQEAAAKLASAEIDDNDLAFEKFLLSLDATIKSDFITKELNPTSSDQFEDISQFEKLQKKILVFCQSNIGDLTEAFKNVANNRIDNPNAPIRTKIITRPVESLPSPPKIKYEPRIPTPTPTTPKSLSVSSKGFQPQGGKGNAFSYYGQSNAMPNPLIAAMMQNPQPFQNQGYDQSFQNTKGSGLIDTLSKPSAQPKVNALINNMNNTLNSATSAHQTYVNNLYEMINQVQNEKTEETERRMTFLFQQLYSLETLLSNTRNELMKLESTIKKDERRNAEVIKVEDEKMLDRNAGNPQNFHSAMEQLLKTKQ